MKEMRERLATLLRENCGARYCENMDECEGCCKKVADALIAAGVILPKFKVGQKVWQFILTEESIREITICYIVESWSGKILYYERGDWLLDEKYLYATEQEAGDALAKAEAL